MWLSMLMASFKVGLGLCSSPALLLLSYCVLKVCLLKMDVMKARAHATGTWRFVGSDCAVAVGGVEKSWGARGQPKSVWASQASSLNVLEVSVTIFVRGESIDVLLLSLLQWFSHRDHYCKNVIFGAQGHRFSYSLPNGGLYTCVVCHSYEKDCQALSKLGCFASSKCLHNVPGSTQQGPTYIHQNAKLLHEGCEGSTLPVSGSQCHSRGPCCRDEDVCLI